jgi:hypothetical protein
MLGCRLAQQVDALAMEQHDRADVRVELDVEVLRLDLADRRTDPDTRVVDEHVHAAVAIANSSPGFPATCSTS